MQTVLNNVLVNYESLGNGKTTMLVLHGWGRSLDDWRQVSRELSKKSKVFLLDLPGFGNSSLPEENADTNYYSGVVNEFIKKMKVEDIILLGHSFGGKIAIVVAGKNKKVKKLVLVAPSGVEEKSFITTLKILTAKIINKMPLGGVIKERLKDSFSSSDYKNAGSLKRIFKTVVNQKVDREAREITAETLIIWGDRDKELAPRWGKKIRELIGGSRLRIVWGAKHHPHLEKPEKFLEIVNEFV